MKDGDAYQSEAATPESAQPAAAAEVRNAPSPSRVLRALEAARTSAWAAAALASVVSSYLGVVYWIVHQWLLGVVLSALIPGFGFISVLRDLAD